jgi:hypothetical protein
MTPPGPKRVSTARNDATPPALDARDVAPQGASAPKGTTVWYCTKPRGPDVRFQSPTASWGWKDEAVL